MAPKETHFCTKNEPIKWTEETGRGGGGGGGDEREEITFQFLSTFPKYVVNKSIALGLKGRS